MKIRIESAALSYVLPHVSKEASRPVLNGVLVEPSGVIVATSGKTMMAHRGAPTGATAPVIIRFRKPKDTTARKVAYVMLDVPESGHVVEVSTFDGDDRLLGVTLADLVEGPYPNWRGVFPAGDAPGIGAPCLGVDPALLGLFATPNNSPVQLAFYGTGKPVLVTYPSVPNAAGLLMPCTIEADPSVPLWTLAPAPQSAPTLDAAA